MQLIRAASAAAVLATLFGCVGCGPGEPGVLEIGVRGVDDTFVPYAPDELVAVILGANGLNMIVPSLWAEEIDPSAPDPTVEVWVGGILMAADIEGTQVDMIPDGTGHALYDLRVPFQTELCCYNCAAAEVVARIEDRRGRMFEGSLNISLARASCPDAAVCCASANLCPEPSMAPLCM